MASHPPSHGATDDALLAKHHVLFALRNARYLPTPYQAEDNNRYAYTYLHSHTLTP